jgi:hypothetical protein
MAGNRGLTGSNKNPDAPVVRREAEIKTEPGEGTEIPSFTITR